MKNRTHVARAAALALALSPALALAAPSSNDPCPPACHCDTTSHATHSTGSTVAAPTTPEPSEEVKRIWSSP